MSREVVIDLVVNGDPHRILVGAHRSLLDCLRDDLGLTGSKHGCDVGDCGACTVLVDGLPRLSCITLAAEMEGRGIETVEGLTSETPRVIQQAFDEQVAAQCGYCTPGFVVALTSLFETAPAADDAQILEGLGSNICRCTGYTKIIAAAKQARDRLGSS